MHTTSKTRYDNMNYRNCGKSGLKLPVLSLGLWHNFGEGDSFEVSRNMICCAFDHGITHFDLANNYGPPEGSAESRFGEILKKDFSAHRDEMVISTKAGYFMWPGPYGDDGSKKYLTASLDQSLKRMDLDYVDVFYHHRPAENTPLEETIQALDLLVRQGKSLYVGLSNYYNTDQLEKALAMLKSLGTPCILHQTRYSMFSREIEAGTLERADSHGCGTICFSPLAQGVLTDKYLKGIPNDSRAAGSSIFLRQEQITDTLITKIRQLNDLAANREQTLAQMALSWILRDRRISSVIIGASKTTQIENNLEILNAPAFTREELILIEDILNEQD